MIISGNKGLQEQLRSHIYTEESEAVHYHTLHTSITNASPATGSQKTTTNQKAEHNGCCLMHKQYLYY